MILLFSVTKTESTGQTVVKTFSQFMRRPGSERDGSRATATAYDILDEQYEVLDSGAFWDETAEVLDPASSLAS